MSSRLFLDIETPQESDRTWTSGLRGSTRWTHAQPGRGEQEAQGDFGQSYRGGGSLEWRYCFSVLMCHLGGGPVGLYRFWKKNTAPKRPPLQEGAERDHSPPPTPTKHTFPNKSKRTRFALGSKGEYLKSCTGKASMDSAAHSSYVNTLFPSQGAGEEETWKHRVQNTWGSHLPQRNRL